MAQSTLKMFFLSSKFLLTFYILAWIDSGPARGDDSPFQPHMLLHTIQGCPANSICNEEMGKRRQAWLSLVKQVRDKKLNLMALEEFRKNQGFPFNVWLKGDMQPKDEVTTPPADLGKLKVTDKGPIAYWDSPCEYHRKQEQPIHTAQIFLKDLSRKSKEQIARNFQGTVQLQKAYLFGPNIEKAPSEFVIPRDEFPLYLTPQKLVFVLEEEGLFYHLGIDHSGNINIAEPATKNSNPTAESLTCPDYALRPLAQLSGPDKTIYQVPQCRQYTYQAHQYILLIPSGCF
ncbi:MAG: hypothetical protein A2X86_11280 [Bdellovibrionales bacterium GWA2_49_15]|nr:MAG: hypothetical protein A2X86_11280 [Bdellovibrionales bacterium GWA2_49_15]HAZ12667.1 hypothetical protein [Bdellovibrionales bacterium]